jgi:hypothetical protein
MSTHSELGRRPCQPAYLGKVDRESGCGSFGSNQAGNSVGPSAQEGFLFPDSVIDADLVQAFRETHYRVRPEQPEDRALMRVSRR